MISSLLLALSASASVFAAPRLPVTRSKILLNNETIPANFTPTGGVDTLPTSPPPIYQTISDFDFQSLNLALNQEWIELDLFHYGLAKFSVAEFEEAGLGADDRFLLEFMADQEVGHSTLLSNILGPRAAKPCNYTYPFTTVRQFVDFSQKLTRFGEAGVYGFLPHLDSRPSAQMLLQSITTEARQQLIFRQFAGAFPMPVWFETGIAQAWAWTLLSPYISHCPAENPLIEFQIFPSLNITNNPSIISSGTNGSIVTHESGTTVYYPTTNSSSSASLVGPGAANGSALYLAALTHNRTSLSYAGREVHLKWEAPGKVKGYDGRYTTNTTAGLPKFAAWVSQLNTTYTPLYNLNLTSHTASTIQPNGTVFGGKTTPIVNGTMFVALTDAAINVTPYNFTLINPHVVAGPALYQAD